MTPLMTHLAKAAQAQPPAVAGQLLIASAHVDVKKNAQGQRALVIVPAGTNLQIIVPMDDAACKTIGGGLISTNLVIP